MKVIRIVRTDVRQAPVQQLDDLLTEIPAVKRGTATLYQPQCSLLHPWPFPHAGPAIVPVVSDPSLEPMRRRTDGNVMEASCASVVSVRTSVFSHGAGSRPPRPGQGRDPLVRALTRHIRSPVSRIVACGIASILALAGCGTKDPATQPSAPPPATATISPSPSPAEMTHEAFVKRLDATCSKSGADLAAAADAAGNNMEKLAPITASFASRVSKTLDDQKTLRAPTEDRAAFRRYLAAQHRIVGIYSRMGAALRAHDLEQTQYLIGLAEDVRADRTRAAIDLGSRRCGS